MEQDHAVRRREEAKRIRLEQERDYAKFQEQLKAMGIEEYLGIYQDFYASYLANQ